MDTAVKPEVREDHVLASHDVFEEMRQLENEWLRPHDGQLACRLDEIPFVGGSVTRDIYAESIIVLRETEVKIRAFGRLCSHWGRHITCGRRTTARLCMKSTTAKSRPDELWYVQ